MLLKLGVNWMGTAVWPLIASVGLLVSQRGQGCKHPDRGQWGRTSTVNILGKCL